MRWAERASPETALRVAWDAASRAAAIDVWELAAYAYAVAMRAVRDLVGANQVISAKENWLAEAYGVATRAAYALYRCDRPQDAVVALEHGRGLLLRDALKSHGLGDDGDLDFTGIRTLLLQPLLYLVPGPVGGVGILIEPDHPRPICVPIAELTESTLGARVRSFHTAASAADRNPLAWQRTLERIGAWLGDILEPVVSRIPVGRFTLIPTGALSFLPVHAARTSMGVWSFADTHIVEYAPTAQSVIGARLKAAPSAQKSLVAIIDPAPTSETSLQFAADEARAASLAASDVRMIVGTEATLERVLSELAGCTIMHFACHGRADLLNPRASGVVLADDAVLSGSSLAELDLAAAQLAILSACETGVPGRGAPDEVTTLGSAFFAAGVDGVISSLWPVPDFDTLVLVTLLYARLKDGADAASALTQAQSQMRSETNGELLRSIRSMCDAALLSRDMYDLIEHELAESVMSERDFSGSDSWAGFTFTGFTALARVTDSEDMA